ncbi:hypothetical protein E2C01_010622 [Portunus trituberculatus]|uniref:Uncharacterized protein n=1 Tax=Portunus trituberculatus TaxID=210409 RepID=A0A5B7D8W1_PORTR|nr:hypothetical protein [Portunus trituberculatus]
MTVIGLDMATLLGIQLSSLMPADGDELYAAGNHPLTCVGTFSSHLKLGDREAETVVIVVKELDELLNKGIIESVDYLMAWCHPIMPVPKKTSGVRLCVDLIRLNRYVKRPVYPHFSIRVTRNTTIPAALSIRVVGYTVAKSNQRIEAADSVGSQDNCSTEVYSRADM